MTNEQHWGAETMAVPGGKGIGAGATIDSRGEGKAPVADAGAMARLATSGDCSANAAEASTSSSPDASSGAAVGAVLAGISAFVLFGHLWPALMAAVCGAAAGGLLFVIGQRLLRLVLALRRAPLALAVFSLVIAAWPLAWLLGGAARLH